MRLSATAGTGAQIRTAPSIWPDATRSSKARESARSSLAVPAIGVGERLTTGTLYASIQRVSTAALSRISRTGAEPAGRAVYASVREAIVSTELQPGQQISENELAAQLGVSRTPVREALARLRDDRLVEIVPQLGTFVSRISVAGVDDAQFLREALECSAVRLAADRCAAGDLRELEALIARQEEARDAGDA